MCSEYISRVDASKGERCAVSGRRADADLLLLHLAYSRHDVIGFARGRHP